MDRFARELDAWITRERDYGPECECGNSREHDQQHCADCIAEIAADAAQAVLTRTMLEVTGRIAAAARRAAKHVELAEAIDAQREAAGEPLFIGAATEAPTPLYLACQEYIGAGHGDPSHFVAGAA